MNIGLLPYQRLESGKNNPTLKTMLKVIEIFPEIELDKIAYKESLLSPRIHSRNSLRNIFPTLVLGNSPLNS